MTSNFWPISHYSMSSDSSLLYTGPITLLADRVSIPRLYSEPIEASMSAFGKHTIHSGITHILQLPLAVPFDKEES